ncbi:hypothetical protein [Aeoliella sp. SH292]|uniref:hypothetical protein n=1 Tax=Aeoliella sp. SH292 TaxID=3454464 RepID=UPI003F98C02B
MTRQLQLLQAECDPLELELNAIRTISGKLADPQLKQSLERLRELTDVREALLEDRAGYLSAIEQAQVELTQTLGELRELDEMLETLTAEQAGISSRLQEERSRRAVDSPFPEERRSTKRPYNLTLRYGRLYVDLFADGSPNLADYAVLDDSGSYLVLTPKPYKGVPVLRGDQLSQEVIAQLQAQDPRFVQIDISIWDDSYEAFQPLRDYLVKHDYNYRLIVVTDGDEVTYGSVVDTQVQ